ncbi:MAG: galactose mutarotase [Lewinellaceae bacterium]|nr:galactose mutarotase [Lewinellaceae bacterium]
MRLMKNLTPTMIPGLLLLAIAVVLVQCKSEKKPPSSAAFFEVRKTTYGTTPDGQSVDQYTLVNGTGMEVTVITYGGIITRWTAPDKDGNYDNVVLGFDNLGQYVAKTPYFGAIIGRYGNRIAKGQFSLAGKTYQLETNNGPNHLHGGVKGFDKVVWTASPQQTDTTASLVLTYLSKDGEGGYPGNLSCTVTYTLTATDALKVTYQASTDKETIVNLTQHSYFNLSGNFKKTILDHELMLAADNYLPVDTTLIPTGTITPVAGTPFDFTTAKAIGRDIDIADDQLTKGKGYDHCWVLNPADGLRTVASVVHPATGRQLEIITDEPGLQFYCGNFLNGTLPMPGGGTYGYRTGFCLETQHYPDSPNQPAFPSVILRPGEQYTTTTIFQFSVAK